MLIFKPYALIPARMTYSQIPANRKAYTKRDNSYTMSFKIYKYNKYAEC